MVVNYPHWNRPYLLTMPLRGPKGFWKNQDSDCLPLRVFCQPPSPLCDTSLTRVFLPKGLRGFHQPFPPWDSSLETLQLISLRTQVPIGFSSQGEWEPNVCNTYPTRVFGHFKWTLWGNSKPIYTYPCQLGLWSSVGVLIPYHPVSSVIWPSTLSSGQLEAQDYENDTAEISRVHKGSDG